MAAADLALLRQTVERAGLVLVGRGLDPYREPPRVVDHLRYLAMERYFDREGSWGRTMMRRTASVQVNLTATTPEGSFGRRLRWQLVHRLGPVLVAAFANSPLSARRPPDGRPPGKPPGRKWTQGAPPAACPTRPPPGPGMPWTRSCSAYPAVLQKTGRRPPASPSGTGCGAACGLRVPGITDLDCHLSTLFPPVRPRGWLELRMIDAQDGDDWIAAAAVASVLLDDPAAADSAYATTAPLCGDDQGPTQEARLRAARRGLADPDLAKAACMCFAAADDSVRTVVADYPNRYPERGRCPADDPLSRA